jgi:hypothetical protein
MGLSYTIAVGPRQRSHSRVRVPRDSWSYFTASDSRLPPPGGTGPRSYSPQEQGGRVIPPGTRFFASYDSQGYGWGIRTRLHTGIKDRISSKKYIFSSYFTGNTSLSAAKPNRLTLFRERAAVIRKIYTNSVRTSQETHCVSAIKVNQIMPFRERITVRTVRNIHFVGRMQSSSALK